MNQSCWSGDGLWFRRFSAISCFILFSYSLNSSVIHRCLCKWLEISQLLDCVPEGPSHWQSSAVINQPKAIHFQWELEIWSDITARGSDSFFDLNHSLYRISECFAHESNWFSWICWLDLFAALDIPLEMKIISITDYFTRLEIQLWYLTFLMHANSSLTNQNHK